MSKDNSEKFKSYKIQLENIFGVFQYPSKYFVIKYPHKYKFIFKNLSALESEPIGK